MSRRRNPRYYHGTGTFFERVDPTKLDPSGLYGPAMYYTDDPRVASSYATAGADLSNDWVVAKGIDAQMHMWRKALSKPDLTPEKRAQYERLLAEDERRLGEVLPQLQGVGPQVRPVDVPANLTVLDVDGTTLQPKAKRLATRLANDLVRRGYRGSPVIAALRAASTDGEAYAAIQRAAPLLNTADPDGQMAPSASFLNKLLASSGFDGIRYAGGKVMPITDEAGRPIEHAAIAVFPESLGKVRNALSGRPEANPSPVWPLVAMGVLLAWGMWERLA